MRRRRMLNSKPSACGTDDRNLPGAASRRSCGGCTTATRSHVPVGPGGTPRLRFALPPRDGRGDRLAVRSDVCPEGSCEPGVVDDPAAIALVLLLLDGLQQRAHERHDAEEG